MKRWHEERELMKSRMKQERTLHGVGPDNHDGSICHCLLGIGFVRKRTPGCNREHCTHCHWDKLVEPKRRGASKRAAIDFEFVASG
jgi:hypothetical protein